MIIAREILVKRENHLAERALQLNPKLPDILLKVDQISVPHETPYLRDVVDVDTCLKKSLRFSEATIVWNVLKLQTVPMCR